MSYWTDHAHRWTDLPDPTTPRHTARALLREFQRAMAEYRRLRPHPAGIEARSVAHNCQRVVHGMRLARERGEG